MTDNRNLFLAIALSIVVLIGWQYFIGMPQMVLSGSPATLWSGEPVLAGEEDKDVPVRVTLPDGGVINISGRNGTATFGATDKVGIYEAEWAAAGNAPAKKSYFAVNLMSPAESDIRPEALQAPSGSNVQQRPGVAVQNKEIWQWFAAAALAVLLAEWWIYHRRIG